MLKYKLIKISIFILFAISNLTVACQPTQPERLVFPTAIPTEISKSDLKNPPVQVENVNTHTSENHYGIVKSSTRLDEQISQLVGLGLDDFYEESFLIWLSRDPEKVVSLGLPSSYDNFQYQWTDISDAYCEETSNVEESILQILKTFDRSILPVNDQITYDLYEWFWTDQIQKNKFHDFQISTDSLFSIEIQNQIVDFLVEDFPLKSIKDFNSYIDLVEKVDVKVDQAITLMDSRKKKGTFPSKDLVKIALQQTNSYLPGSVSHIHDSQDSQLYLRFARDLRTFSFPDDSLKISLLDQLTTAINQSFFSAYQNFADYLFESLSATRESNGLWQFPEGDSYYLYLIKHFTGSDLTPEQIIAQGQLKVDEIQMRIFQLGEQANLSTSANDFSTLLAKFRTSSPSSKLIAGIRSPAGQEEISRNQEFLGNMAAQFVDINNISLSFPENWPLSEKPLATELDPWQEILQMHTSDGDLINSNDLFVVNALNSRFQLTHEQANLDSMPLFRRYMKLPAYRESWQSYFLYFLSTGKDINLYQKFSIAQHELFLSSCMVVDSGIHAKGWSKEEGTHYLESINDLGSDVTSIVVDRIISNPGEILSFAVSLEKLVNAQQLVEASLHEKFILQDYNSFILSQGSLPLSEFDKLVDNYILQGTKMNVPNIQP